MSDQDQSRLHAIVEGRVQGVGFRAFVTREADRLGITGWVRNRRDGSVEVVAEGKRSSLDQLLSALRRGPAAASVIEVKPNWKTGTGEFDQFNVKYSI